MKRTKAAALLITGIAALAIGEATKPTYAVTHKVPQYQVVLIALGLAATILLILYVIATVWARKLNKENK